MADQKTYIFKSNQKSVVIADEFSGRVRGASAKAKALLATKALSHRDVIRVYCVNEKGHAYVGKAMFCGIGTTGQRIEWITKNSGIAGVGAGSVRAIGINRSARLGVTYK